jgi:hypothetical protein
VENDNYEKLKQEAMRGELSELRALVYTYKKQIYELKEELKKYRHLNDLIDSTDKPF